MNRRKLRGSLMLLLTALVWGMGFVAQSAGMDYIGPFTFLAARSFLGCLVLLPVMALTSRKIPGEKPVPGERRTLILGGILCGTALFVASGLQQMGIQETTAGKAGFLTAMYIVLVPVFGLFLGRRPGAKVWGAVALALAACARGKQEGFKLGNPGVLTELYPPFWVLYNNLPEPHMTRENKEVPAEPVKSRRRVITSAVAVPPPLEDEDY